MNNLFAKVVLIFISIIIILVTLHDLNYKNPTYWRMKQDAEHLLSLDCKPEECITTGQIRYLKTITAPARSLSNNPDIYYYDYTFQFNNVTYNNNIQVYTEGSAFSKGVRWLPNARISSGKTFPEKIKFDPYNPHINLPLSYLPIINKASDPNKNSTKDNIFFIILGIFFLYCSYRLETETESK